MAVEQSNLFSLKLLQPLISGVIAALLLLNRFYIVPVKQRFEIFRVFHFFIVFNCWAFVRVDALRDYVLLAVQAMNQHILICQCTVKLTFISNLPVIFIALHLIRLQAPVDISKKKRNLLVALALHLFENGALSRNWLKYSHVRIKRHDLIVGPITRCLHLCLRPFRHLPFPSFHLANLLLALLPLLLLLLRADLRHHFKFPNLHLICCQLLHFFRSLFSAGGGFLRSSVGFRALLCTMNTSTFHHFVRLAGINPA